MVYQGNSSVRKADRTRFIKMGCFLLLGCNKGVAVK